MKSAHVPPDGPGVAFPPLMIFVMAFGVGLGLKDLYQLPIVPPEVEPWRVRIGVALVVAGMVIFWWGLLTLLRAGTGVMLERPASELIARGPYRWSRNPQYVGCAVSYFGLSVVANTGWPLVLLPVVMLLLVIIVVRREERYLRSQFGPAYDAYCQRVRRFL